MAITTPILDLMVLDAHSSKLLVIGDASIYPANFTPSAPTLEVKVPGYSPKQIPFVPSNVQVYNSYTLGLTCDDDDCPIELPDGLYRLVYTIAPAQTYRKEMYYLKVDRLYEKWDQAYLKIDIFSRDGRIQEADGKLLQEIEQYIQGAIAAVNMNDQKLAVELYQKADKRINAFLEARCY